MVPQGAAHRGERDHGSPQLAFNVTLTDISPLRAVMAPMIIVPEIISGDR